MNILFLTLNTYSLTGGIEKVCRVLADVLNDFISEKKIGNATTLSFHDKLNEHNRANYRSFGSNKILFSIATFRASLKADVVILSHINLLIFAKLIKGLYPKKRIVLIAHGIEVWKPLAIWKTKFLKQIEVWAVSKYTADKMQNLHQLYAKNIKVLPNGLPKEFAFANLPKTRTDLLKRFGVEKDAQVILTVCRLSSAEKYKGYDLVILALKDLIKSNPGLCYFIVGKADEMELIRVRKLISSCGLEKNVILTGYVDDNLLAEFYQNADIFAMPSKGEGFGIVFIEAIAKGCDVLAGNADGSVDALLNGKIGTLVDPEDSGTIYSSLLKMIETPAGNELIAERQELVKANFGFERYKANVAEVLGILA